MKFLKFFGPAFLMACCFALFTPETASAQGLELTIEPSAAGFFYQGWTKEQDCSGASYAGAWGPQATGTGVYYPGTGTDMPYYMEVTDMFGNTVGVCDPVNAFCPSVAVLPTGTVVEWQYWGGCLGHPAVVVIY
ncbi:MAG: hypothetical protein ACFB10_25935 [Salibacteraceae bacterium]